MNSKLLFAIIVLFILGAFVLSAKKSNDNNNSENPKENTTTEVSPNTDESKNSKNELAQNSQYLEYRDGVEFKDKTLLFFHADWCPTCKGAEKDILRNISKLPKDLTIYKVDYDNQTDLVDKYKVNYQHTFVQVDQEGNEITRWSGGGVNTILNELK